MADYDLIVLSNPVAGMEGEFRDWYDNRHLPDLMNIPGIGGAVRFERVGDGRWASLAIYEFTADDPQMVIAAILERWKTDIMPTHEAFDEAHYEMIVMQKTKRL